MTQAAVSARVRQLEELLGVKLFTRSRNNIQLTNEGERLVSHAETVLLAWSRARQDLALDLDMGQRGQLHIGVRSGLWNAALQERLQELHEQMPDVTFRTEGHMPDAAVKMLLDRTLDIAISYDPPNLPEFKLRPVGKLRLNLYSADRGASVESALQSGYVYVDWGSAFARFHANRLGESVVPVLRTNLGESAAEFVRSNGGAAFLPPTLASRHKGALHKVAGSPAYSRALHAAYRTNSDRLSLIEAVLDVFEGLEI